jgi:hypothetical protein
VLALGADPGAPPVAEAVAATALAAFPAAADAVTGEVALVPADDPCDAGSVPWALDPQATPKNACTPTSKLQVRTACCKEHNERAFRERK